MKNWPKIIHRIIQIARRIHSTLAEECKRKHIAITRHHTVMELYFLGGECGQEDLVNATCLNKGTLSRCIKELEGKGYLLSFPDTGNPLRRQIKLTRKGRHYAMETLKKARLREQAYYQSLSESDQEKLRDYLDRFYHQVRKDKPKTPLPTEWPILGPYCMNLLKYIDCVHPSFRYDHREINQKHILMGLLHQNGESTFKKLETKYCMAQAVVVRQMVKLARKGSVMSQSDDHDRRIKIAKLTPEGRKKAEIILDEFIKLEQTGCSGFSLSEKKEFEEYLYSILTAFDCIEIGKPGKPCE